MRKKIKKNLDHAKSYVFRRAGQSLIEVVFSIGVIALVITGSVILIVSAVGLKNSGFQRKRATEMAELVVENLIDQKENNGDSFWNLEAKSDEELSGFEGYKYSVGYDSTGLSCSNCTNATVTINWGNDQELKVNRFFAK